MGQQPTGVHHLAFMAGDIKKHIAFFSQVMGCPLVALFDMHGVPGGLHAFLRMNDHSYFSIVQLPEVEEIPIEIGKTHAGNGALPSAPPTASKYPANVTLWMNSSDWAALGFVIDRFGLILHRLPAVSAAPPLWPRVLSAWGGSILIGMGVAMALAAGVRYLRFAIEYHRNGATRVRHGILIGALFSLLLALFGLVLIVLLVAILD